MKKVNQMAHYTVTIKTLLDNGFDFGLKNYPIFNEGYRSTLNQNILNYLEHLDLKLLNMYIVL